MRNLALKFGAEGITEALHKLYVFLTVVHESKGFRAVKMAAQKHLQVAMMVRTPAALASCTCNQRITTHVCINVTAPTHSKAASAAAAASDEDCVGGGDFELVVEGTV